MLKDICESEILVINNLNRLDTATYCTGRCLLFLYFLLHNVNSMFYFLTSVQDVLKVQSECIYTATESLQKAQNGHLQSPHCLL